MGAKIAVHGLEELFFQLCHCVSFLVPEEIFFGVTYVLTVQFITVEAFCQFFGYGKKLFFVLLTYLEYKTDVRLCQFFGCGGK